MLNITPLVLSSKGSMSSLQSLKQYSIFKTLAQSDIWYSDGIVFVSHLLSCSFSHGLYQYILIHLDFSLCGKKPNQGENAPSLQSSNDSEQSF